jgi:ubiquinone/menaquinone biosynthesis C-methylase UbiE
MKRETTNRILWALDQLLPPVLRDSPAVMKPLMRLAVGRDAPTYLAFKDRAFQMSTAEFSAVYEGLDPVDLVHGDTDLSDRSMARLLDEVGDGDVLEVGCGRGALAGRLARSPKRAVTAVDLVIDPDLHGRHPAVTFDEANIEALPFPDGAFPTVVCTHTLEHVQHLPRALAELRRVCSDRLLIVVPRQRPYRYTFNLHIHFFPYEWSIESAFGTSAAYQLDDVDGDWHYTELVTG